MWVPPEIERDSSTDRLVGPIRGAPALRPEWVAKADPSDLGRVWGAAVGWAGVDPVGYVAATRVKDRLGDMAPATMAQFTELRDSGTDQVDAMRDVLTGHGATRLADGPGRREEAAQIFHCRSFVLFWLGVGVDHNAEVTRCPGLAWVGG